MCIREGERRKGWVYCVREKGKEGQSVREKGEGRRKNSEKGIYEGEGRRRDSVRDGEEREGWCVPKRGEGGVESRGEGVMFITVGTVMCVASLLNRG